MLWKRYERPSFAKRYVLLGSKILFTVAKWVRLKDPTNKEVVGEQREGAFLAPPDSFWLLMTPPWLLLLPVGFLGLTKAC